MCSTDKTGLNPTSKDYAVLARSVMTASGGIDNIIAVTRRTIRLRFVTRNDSQVGSATLKALAGTLGVMCNDNQCQVITDNTVSQVYCEVVGLLPANMQPAKPQIKPRLTLKRIGAETLDALIGTMPPLIPAIIGGSMLRLLATVLGMTGVLVKGSSTLAVLTIIDDGAFLFLPLTVAALAVIRLKTNMSLIIVIASVPVHLSFADLATRATQGEHVEFTLIPVMTVRYTYTVIPALVMTWCLSYVEHWVDRITSVVTKNFLKPMLIVLIAAPLTIVIIGPISVWVGSAISALIYTIHGYPGWLSATIVDALWPLLVMTGMHRVFTPTIIRTTAEAGKGDMMISSETGANLLLGGSSLIVAWKTKNPELRQTVLAAAVSVVMAGIFEPALYGVAIHLKHPLIASLIGGFICGAAAGMAGLTSHSMMALGLLASVQFFSPTNPMTIVWIFGIMALAVVFSSILTLILGFEDIPVEDVATQARKNQAA